MIAHNPLLQPVEGGLPAFDTIGPEHVTPAIDRVLADAEAALEAAVGAQTPAEWDAMARTLDVPIERLNTVWATVCHLQAVADTPALRAAHTKNLPRITEFTTRLGADPRLFAKYQALAAAPGSGSLSAARRKALADALRDFVLGGAELQGAARERYAALQERLSELSQRFGEHVLDATDAWTLLVPEASLDGVPADVKQAAREAALAAADTASLPDGRPAFKLTLKQPCYVPVLTYATDRALRETIFRAYSTRASELGDPALDNSSLMREIVALRAEEAALLGYPDFATMALVPKMARSAAEVRAFVRDLAGRARPFAERDLAEMREFAARALGIADLQAWDRAFVAERMQQERYAFSSEELKQYFTEPTVLAGLFRLVETLFGVAIRPDRAPVWHESVRFFRVWRIDPARPGDTGEEVAAFYLDPYARAGKQGGAWMDVVRQRWQRPDGATQLPVAHMVCNFAPPVGGRPALLTHDDLITLFHEFGHGLHHMLTRVNELAVSGISGVEHDAVELPSQFMENFCWEWEALQRLSSHVDTGEPLPRALFERMREARNFQRGLQLVRQCEFGLFDIRIHSEAGAHERLAVIRDEVNAEVQPVRAPDFARYPHSFGHLFDGGYAAGYYGYAWAEVLSADAYGAFEESGVFDPATGARFRDQILAVGGSRPALESFRAFRGREPTLDALLRHQGLVEGLLEAPAAKAEPAAAA